MAASSFITSALEAQPSRDRQEAEQTTPGRLRLEVFSRHNPLPVFPRLSYNADDEYQPRTV
ncbi:MAG: hypothetical protein ACK4RK_21530 [Gemmataceae bacterium]